MKNVRLLIKVMSILWIFLLGSGCATSRSILDINVPSSPNIQSNNAVKITQVSDLRKFESKPSQPSTPSLKGDQINDKTITLRAVARKRNGYGKALGDVLLPEGRTVEDIVKESVEKALREKGYNVVGTEESNALPLEVEIHQFWSWVQIGFWTGSMEFEALVDIKSPVLQSGNRETIRGYVLLHTQAATDRAWMNTINKGIENLIAAIMEKIKEP